MNHLDPSLTLQDLGEQGLLREVQRFCPAGLVGDDGAVLRASHLQNWVVTTDLLVAGVHFSDLTTSAEDVGWRGAAANLSDLAAMGATPVGITVGLALPPSLPVVWVQQLYAGLTACLAPWQTPIVGGDICRSQTCTIAITALGDVRSERAIRRATVQVGDAVVVTGVHGAAKAGLELLLNPTRGEQLPDGDRQRWILAHQRPRPRLDVSNYIMAQGWPRVAGMDSSDGLADAILQLCRASGVGAHIQAQRIPLPRGLVDWVGAAQALDWGLYGGEDFELVLCLPLPQAEALVRHWGEPTRIIGHITPEPAVILEVAPHHTQELKWESGFQHFGAELA